MGFDRVSRDCLRGQPLPEDLRRLWEANDEQPWNDLIAFTLVEKLENDFFRGYRKEDGAPADVVKAYQRMFEHIAFVGQREDGELVGYWLGPENRAISASPIVELDTEGQFCLQGRNLAEYLLACVPEEEYTNLRRILGGLGLKVAAKTQSKLLDSFDDLDGDFGNPNRVSRRYQEGLDAPPQSELKFGNFRFPRAADVLKDLGIGAITASSTKKEVMQLLGKPDETGGATKVPVLGVIAPWIRYRRPDCLLRFEFDEQERVAMVTLLEPDWKPGM